MIKFFCSCCKTKMEAPSSVAGTKLSCPECGARERVPNPVVVPTVVITDSPIVNPVKKSTNPLASAYSNIPSAFKNGFLATLGAFAAMAVCYYGYFKLSPVQFGTVTSQNALVKHKATLDAYHLYHTGTSPEVIFGRLLNRCVFLPDINMSTPSLSVWLDENNAAQAYSVELYGDKICVPYDGANESYKKSSWFRAERVINGFKHLVDIKKIGVSDLSFSDSEIVPNQEIAFKYLKKGTLVIHRSPEGIDKKRNNEIIYYYNIVYHTW